MSKKMVFSTSPGWSYSIPLVHISHEDLLNKMLKDHDMDALSAISCFTHRNLHAFTIILGKSFYFWVVRKTCKLFLMEDLWKLGEYPPEIRNNQSTISRNQILRFLWRIGNQKQVQTVADLLPPCAFLMRHNSWIGD